jgi:hypothetical protein
VRAGSLIPSDRNRRHQLRVYEADTTRAGLCKMHGLHHAYAQIRYQELTGWKSSVAGGPQVKTFTEEQEQIDHQARQTISFELGPVREQVTEIYQACFCNRHIW